MYLWEFLKEQKYNGETTIRIKKMSQESTLKNKIQIVYRNQNGLLIDKKWKVYAAKNTNPKLLKNIWLKSEIRFKLEVNLVVCKKLIRKSIIGG